MLDSILKELVQPLYSFLLCETPQNWIKTAILEENIEILLIDHMICELKAAQTAAFLLRKYTLMPDSGELLLTWLAPYENLIYHSNSDTLPTIRNGVSLNELHIRTDVDYATDLTSKLLLLIREELHHFYQVWQILQRRNIPYYNISAGRYAKVLMQKVRTFEPARLVDKLICAALIEARSCERFAKLIPYVDEELSQFYLSLLRSEARHYQDYLKAAQLLTTEEELKQRIELFTQRERDLIVNPDTTFRFHSGVV